MAKFSVSPGVTTSEIDNTFLTLQPVQAGAAIIGPTVKGPVELPTLVTSYADYVNRFGDVLVSGSDTYSYFTSNIGTPDASPLPGLSNFTPVL